MGFFENLGNFGDAMIKIRTMKAVEEIAKNTKKNKKKRKAKK